MLAKVSLHGVHERLKCRLEDLSSVVPFPVTKPIRHDPSTIMIVPVELRPGKKLSTSQTLADDLRLLDGGLFEQCTSLAAGPRSYSFRDN